MSLFKLVYITGTRADFGLMRSTLALLATTPSIDLSLIVTGMHLDERYGSTVREVEAANFRIAGTVPLDPGPPTGATMARHIGQMIGGFTDLLEAEQPDLLLLLGDRGEMLAGAIAAAHLNIAIAHVAGGDRSGTIDEPVRHAISKLAHIHFTSTQASADRLERMGERADCIFAIGTPSLDDIIARAIPDKAATRQKYGLDPARRLAMLIYHPVLHHAAAAGAEAAAILGALDEFDTDVLAILPNSDAGSEAIRAALLARADDPRWTVLPNVARDDYLALLASADVLMGNSSSGIVEAASFGTPVINIGDRQNHRERNANTLDVPSTRDAVTGAIRKSFEKGRYSHENVYGDGGSGRRIRDLLVERPWGADILAKSNSY